eukprot:403375596
MWRPSNQNMRMINHSIPFECNFAQVCNDCELEFPTKNHLVTCKCSNIKWCLDCAKNHFDDQISSSSTNQNSMNQSYDQYRCERCNKVVQLQAFSDQLSSISSLSSIHCYGSQTSKKTQLKPRKIEPLRPRDTQLVESLLKFRIVQENLLYVIGIPEKYADENLLASQRYFGLYGEVKKIRINRCPKDSYEGQCAIYVWYSHPIQVAVAIKCLSGLKFGTKGALKCSYGTSKYCANFLKDSYCEAFESEKSCPFLHYLERRRDKVIEDDPEFREYLNFQDSIVESFMYLLGIQIPQSELQRYQDYLQKPSDLGFPNPFDLLGNRVEPAITMRIDQYLFKEFNRVQYLFVKDNDNSLMVTKFYYLPEQQQYDYYSDNNERFSEIMLPSIEPVFEVIEKSTSKSDQGRCIQPFNLQDQQKSLQSNELNKENLLKLQQSINFNGIQKSGQKKRTIKTHHSPRIFEYIAEQNYPRHLKPQIQQYSMNERLGQMSQLQNSYLVCTIPANGQQNFQSSCRYEQQFSGQSQSQPSFAPLRYPFNQIQVQPSFDHQVNQQVYIFQQQLQANQRSTHAAQEPFQYTSQRSTQVSQEPSQHSLSQSSMYSQASNIEKSSDLRSIDVQTQNTNWLSSKEFVPKKLEKQASVISSVTSQSADSCLTTPQLKVQSKIKEYFESTVVNPESDQESSYPASRKDSEITILDVSEVHEKSFVFIPQTSKIQYKVFQNEQQGNSEQEILEGMTESICHFVVNNVLKDDEIENIQSKRMSDTSIKQQTMDLCAMKCWFKL